MISVQSHRQQLSGNNLSNFKMKKFLFFAIFLLATQITFSQTAIKPGMNAINHKVASGETVLDIAKKYGVDPAEIYRANRFAIDGIKEDMVLQFYAPQKPSEIEISTENYEAKPESVSAEIIPVKSTDLSIAVVPISAKVTNRGYHTVQKGETLYGLSKMYNVTVDDIKNSNTILMKNSLQAGQKLKIPDGTIVGNNEKAVEVVSKQEKAPAEQNKYKTGDIITHKVAPKETLYSLAKKYNVTVDDIINQNEKALKNGLQAGQVLTIKVN